MPEVPAGGLSRDKTWLHVKDFIRLLPLEFSLKLVTRAQPFFDLYCPFALLCINQPLVRRSEILLRSSEQLFLRLLGFLVPSAWAVIVAKLVRRWNWPLAINDVRDRLIGRICNYWSSSRKYVDTVIHEGKGKVSWHCLTDFPHTKLKVTDGF